MRELLLLPLLVGTGCVTHIAEYEPRARDYQAQYSMPDDAVQKAPGAIYSDAGVLASPLADVRARRPGDVLTVVIDEETLAERAADTDLHRSAEEQAQIQRLLGALAALRQAAPDIPIDPTLQASASSSFEGGGSTTRREAVSATIPCTVRKVLATGNLFVEGHRVILVNQDEQHLYISGVVRPEDVDSSNTVMSTRIVDAEVEFTGNGVVAERQRPGWLTRFLGWISPL